MRLASVLVLATLVAPAVAAADAAAAAAAAQRGNYAEAYCIWRALADRGDAEAQYNLGWLYHNGYGLAIDDAEALRWWEKAAAQEYPDALHALGGLYRAGGQGVARDGARAVDYFLRAAARGDEESALLLRSLLARNDRTVRDRSTELLTRHAAALGAPVVVQVERATFRKAPGTESSVLSVHERGKALIELSRRAGWVQVGDPADGRIGWVSAKLVEKAPAAEAPAGK